MKYRRITINPKQGDGMPCIRGLQIPVAMVVDMVASGMGVDEILDLYPDLQVEDIVEVLLFVSKDTNTLH